MAWEMHGFTHLAILLGKARNFTERPQHIYIFDAKDMGAAGENDAPPLGSAAEAEGIRRTHPRRLPKKRRRRKNMSKKSNRINVPEARAAMDKFKMEAANEVGVNLKQGYNGDLSSREAGSVGGQMVKKMTTIRTSKFSRIDRTAVGHLAECTYRACLTI